MEPNCIVTANKGGAITFWRKPKKLFSFKEVGNLREIIEVLKFLTPKEAVGIARVSKRFYEACFDREIQKPEFRKVRFLDKGDVIGYLYSALCEEKELLVLASNSVIRIWSLTAEKLIKEVECGRCNPLCVAISRMGKHMAAGCKDKKIRLWNVTSGKLVDVTDGHEDLINAVAFSSKGTKLVSGSDDTTLRVWKLPPRTLMILRGHTARVNSVVVSKSDEYIISGSDDKTVRVWSLDSGGQIRVLEGHSRPVKFVQISKEDELVFSSSNEVRVWSLASGETTQILKTGSGTFGLSHDESYLVSGSDDNSSAIKVWNLATGQKTLELRDYSGGLCSVCVS